MASTSCSRLDTSRSMLAEDVAPDRLERARAGGLRLRREARRRPRRPDAVRRRGVSGLPAHARQARVPGSVRRRGHPELVPTQGSTWRPRSPKRQRTLKEGAPPADPPAHHGRRGPRGQGHRRGREGGPGRVKIFTVGRRAPPPGRSPRSERRTGPPTSCRTRADRSSDPARREDARTDRRGRRRDLPPAGRARQGIEDVYQAEAAAGSQGGADAAAASRADRAILVVPLAGRRAARARRLVAPEPQAQHVRAQRQLSPAAFAALCLAFGA